MQLNNLPRYSTRRIIFWMVGPIALIIISIMMFAVVNFLFPLTGSQNQIAHTLVNVSMFLVGAVSVILLPIGLVYGIIMLTRNGQRAAGPPPITSSAENTLEASRGWNWGAFFLTWIWGIFNGVPLSLLVWIPFLNVIFPFVLGAKGNQWAWEGARWESVEQFRAVQRKWAIWGTVIVLPVIVWYVYYSVTTGTSKP